MRPPRGPWSGRNHRSVRSPAVPAQTGSGSKYRGRPRGKPARWPRRSPPSISGRNTLYACKTRIPPALPGNPAFTPKQPLNVFPFNCKTPWAGQRDHFRDNSAGRLSKLQGSQRKWVKHMTIDEMSISGVFSITPKRLSDDRGWFSETYSQKNPQRSRAEP